MDLPDSSGSSLPYHVLQRLSVVEEVPEEMDSAATPAQKKITVNATVTTVSGVPSLLPSPTKTDPDADLESSRPSSRDGTPEHMPSSSFSSFSRNRMNYLRLAAICLAQLTSGLTDSATGTLIPTMESHYFNSPAPSSHSNLSLPETQTTAHLQVSLLFVGQAFGFILGAAFGDPIRSLFQQSPHSYSSIFTLSNLTVAVAYIPLILTASPFALIVLSFFLLGFGNSFNLALGNVFVGELGTTQLGIMHGMYGVGGTVGPLIANTIVVSGKDVSWGMYYCITLGLAVLGMVGMGWSFWGYVVVAAEEVKEDEKAGGKGGGLDRENKEKGGIKAKTQHWQASLAAIDWGFVLLGALFIFAYQGAEVSISGWAYTFLREERGAETEFGYATAGFWGGITLGRFWLTFLGPRFGEKHFVYVLAASCVILQILVWFVKSAIAGSVVFGMIGLLLGPVYPCAAKVFMRNMEEEQRATGIGIISAFGMSGGALAPFLSGAIADSCGSWVLNPIVMVLYGAMLVCWYFLPDSKDKPTMAADQEN
ncbi:MFS general substrate transporter [Cladorrhinum sp. PSN332]|nr:MFS general substrate transporter [Cladorrhinum sp. PSN332]